MEFKNWAKKGVAKGLQKLKKPRDSALTFIFFAGTMEFIDAAAVVHLSMRSEQVLGGGCFTRGFLLIRLV